MVVEQELERLVVLAACWSHSRRKFYELHVAKSSKVATERSSAWQSFGRLRKPSAAKILTPVSQRVRNVRRLLSVTSSHFDR
ncbi:hypothetical protein D3C71_1007090 [compost metagenome]